MSSGKLSETSSNLAKTMSDLRFPGSISTERLLLRPLLPTEAAVLKEAIDSSLHHLRPWMPWTQFEPSPIDEIANRIEAFREKFFANIDWQYGMFDAIGDRLLGGCGLHPRDDSSEFEIGYWVRASALGFGYATESAVALTRTAFGSADVTGVIIKCDPRNLRSAAIPPRLGYQLVGIVPSAETYNGRTDDMVWHTTRASWMATAHSS